MKKLKYLFILIISLFIFIPKDTFAATGNIPPSALGYWTNTTWGNYPSLSTITFNEDTYSGAYVPYNVTKMNFAYHMHNYLQVDKMYDLDFVIVANTFGAKLLGATFDDITCSVSSPFSISGYLDSNGETNGSYYYTISCKDYYVHSGYTNLTIYFPRMTGGGEFESMVNNKVGYNFSTKQLLEENKNASNNIANSQQEQTDAIKEQTDATKEQTDTIKDDDTSGSEETASTFFEDFSTDTHGLTSVITAPLNLITSITSSTCRPLSLQIPFVNKTLDLPCMSTIYSRFFGSFLSIYQTITFGFIAYWVCIKIFNLVKDFKNPEHDEIEVMDL